MVVGGRGGELAGSRCVSGGTGERLNPRWGVRRAGSGAGSGAGRSAGRSAGRGVWAVRRHGHRSARQSMIIDDRERQSRTRCIERTEPVETPSLRSVSDRAHSMAVSASFRLLPEDICRSILSYLTLAERVSVSVDDWLTSRVVYADSDEARCVMQFYLSMNPIDVPLRVWAREAMDRQERFARSRRVVGTASTVSLERAREDRRLLRTLVVNFASAACLGDTEMVAFSELRDLMEGQTCGSAKQRSTQSSNCWRSLGSM
jgi:hypothetical protein